MKILHVSTDDSGGGAARASYRIHRALVHYGIDSRMCVLHRGTTDPRVTVAKHLPIASRILHKFYLHWLDYTRRGWYTENLVLHSFGQIGARLVEELNAGDADVLNLHWISNILSVTDIGKLKKPIVWTLHDMWAFCGGEHYVPDVAEARFRKGYRIDNRPRGEHGPDLNRRTWEAKRRAWVRQRFVIVSPSQWLAKCARQSILFSDAAVHVIPNPLCARATWRPIPRDTARIALGLPINKKLILVGAVGGMKDPRKGGELLRDAAAKLKLKHAGNVEMVVFGQDQPEESNMWPCPLHWLGRVDDDRVLVLAYSAADLMVVSSLQDNLPNTAVEAQACGTPVVAFDIGGLPDIVVHRETGWLAKPFDTDDLADGIVWILENDMRRGALSAAARKQAVERFAERVIAAEYSSLYDNILSNS
ncbi:MAG: glycosyltransferase [Candidatus Pacebacteria bacterium]|nr:glycosyltransferase [Candidatus Paceibacterota bacterium]